MRDSVGGNMSYARGLGIVLAACLIVMPACGASLKRNWGKSYEEQKTAQILNPEAGKNATPVQGLSPGAVGNALQGYEETFGRSSAGGDSVDSGSEIGVVTAEGN